MSEKPHHLNAHSPAGHPQRITDADEARSADMHSRTVKYTISMSVRLACFIAAFFVHGWLQVVMLVLAVILPYFAVIVANASGADLDKRTASNYYDGGAPAALAPGGTDRPGEGTAEGAADHAGDGRTSDGRTSSDPASTAGGTRAAGGAGSAGSTESGQDAPQETGPASADVLPGEWYEPQDDPGHPHGARAGHRRKDWHRG